MMKELREQMLVDLQLNGAALSTQKNYLRVVDNLTKYFNRPPEELGEDELKEYMLYLMKESDRWRIRALMRARACRSRKLSNH